MEPETAPRDDDYDILISVENPEIKGDTLKYVVYTLRGQDKLGEINVVRRYSDFNKARDCLVNKWPGCYIPSLPQKKMVGNMDSYFVEERRLGLTFFLETLKKIMHLWYSEQIQMLLKNPSQDLEKALSAIPKPTSGQIILRYTQRFPHLREKVISPDDIVKINVFGQYLKKIQPFLENLIEMTKNNLVTRKKYNEQAEALVGYLLPEYEKNCLKEYLPHSNEEVFIFYGNKDQVIEQQISNMKLINAKNDMDIVYQGLRLQKREVEAFVEAIKVKNDYHSQFMKAREKVLSLEEQKAKINAGKTTLSSMMKTKSKEDIVKDLDAEISAAEKEQNNLSAIVQIATALLTLVEIDKFKKLRQQNYYELVKKSSEFELNIAKSENDLWKAILKSDAMVKADPS